MTVKELEERAEKYAQGRGQAHYNFLFERHSGSPVDFAALCYKEGFKDGVKANEAVKDFTRTEYFLYCLSKEVLADILCDLNPNFCVVKAMEHWKSADFVTAILQESCNYEEE